MNRNSSDDLPRARGGSVELYRGRKEGGLTDGRVADEQEFEVAWVWSVILCWWI